MPMFLGVSYYFKALFCLSYDMLAKTFILLCTGLDKNLKDALAKLGPVKHVVSPNYE